MNHAVRNALVPALLVAGCSATPNNSGSTNVECRPLTMTAPARAPEWRGSVFTIVMENKGKGEILGNGGAPYINQLAKDYAVAGGYHDPFVHPSEPNYIWMASGENFGILNDNDPGSSNTIASTAHIADQLEHAGLTWKVYGESMGAPCGLSSHGPYAVRHIPFAYFSDVNGWNGTTFAPTARCTDHLVDYSQLDADLASGSVPSYVFITPNLDNDMHDGSVAAGDAWLSREVPKILASDAFKNGGVLFLLWDEGSDFGDDPPFIVVSPNAKRGFVSNVAYDTSSYLKTVQLVLGVDVLPCSAKPETVSAMSDLFATPLPAR